MSITVSSIPESLKGDKSITPYIARANELALVNPVVAYYCKLYVLEYILSHKLHTTSKEIEAFTIELLDETESTKTSDDDEGVIKALNDRSISVSIVQNFAYKLFHSCLTTLTNFTSQVNKPELVGKIRATINFLSLLSIFVENDLDWAKLSGGKASTAVEFDKLNKDKIKSLKIYLSKLIKGEIAYKDEIVDDDELERELNKELDKLQVSETEQGEVAETAETNDNLELPGAPKFLPEDDPIAPETKHTAKIDKTVTAGANDGGIFNLPGAPHFLPEDEDEDDSGVKLPGAPKYLPDDDLTGINKSSSIQVITPKSTNSTRNNSIAHVAKAPAPKPVIHHAAAATHHGPAATKESIKLMLDKTESIVAVQKHAKFAISALNYEDLKTAESELQKALELLQLLRSQDTEE